MIETQLGIALWPNGPTLESLQREIADGWVTERWHSSLPLRILNYNQKTQYERHWTPETLACRGLILDAEGNVVQRPFSKFFNLGEQEGAFPVEPFDVFEKMDGSLGILYWDGDQPAIATRGSFHSVQATLATNILRDRCNGDYSIFNRSQTYLFEIIHPQNRIVVDYGDREELQAKPALESNHVPFVKHAEYVYLHRLVTGITPRKVWELLQADTPLDGILERTPDGYQQWIRGIAGDLLQEFKQYLDTAEAYFTSRPETDDRKTLALYFTQFEHPPILFKMLDGRDPSGYIWKLIYPAAHRPYRLPE